MENTNIFYTYIYIDPRKPPHTLRDGLVLSGEPFYVGKGKGKRAYTHLQESSKKVHNTLKHNKIKRILDSNQQPIIIFYKQNLNEKEALLVEQKLIAEIGTKWNIDGIRKGPLCNMTGGGEGKVPCNELRKKYAQHGKDNGMWGRHHSIEVKKRISNYRKTFRHSEETKHKMQLLRQSKNNKHNEMWVVRGPNNDVFYVSWLKEFCKNVGINYQTFYNSLKKGPSSFTRGYCLVGKATS